MRKETLALMGILAVQKFTGGGADINAFTASLRGVAPKEPQPIVLFDSTLSQQPVPTATPQVPSYENMNPSVPQIAAVNDVNPPAIMPSLDVEIEKPVAGNPNKDRSGLGWLLGLGGGLGAWLTLRATLARILKRDEEHSLTHAHGVKISNNPRHRLGRPENHAYTDGRRHIVPQTVHVPAVKSETHRRGVEHSHPDDDHSVHPREATPDGHTGLDPVLPFRQGTQHFRDKRRKSRDR